MFAAVLRRFAVAVVLVVGVARCGSDGAPAQPGDTDFDSVDDSDEDLGPGDDDGDGNGDGDPATDDAPQVVYGLDARPANAECVAFTAPPTTGDVQFADRFANISFNTPVGLTQRPGDNSRWYVVERAGVIKYFPNDAAAIEDDVHTALDLSVNTWTDIDCSMGSLSFPADFETSKYAIVGYCRKLPPVAADPDAYIGMEIRYSRFTTEDGGATFDPASEEVLVALDYDFDATHDSPGLHGADVARFGPDGYFYLTIGDGGPQGRVGGQQAQSLNDLRGKMLRIDVSDPGAVIVDNTFVPGRQEVGADIPSTNPFADGGGHPAIYAYGFRNPWQWSFDRDTGEIWVGDVGHDGWEEVDRGVVPGGNYGWGYFEGSHCAADNGWSTEECAAQTSLIGPLLDYAHGTGAQQGKAVTGGVVYRGTGVPVLTGAYIFGDSSVGNMWVIRNVDTIPASPMPAKVLIADGIGASAFAEDQDGEVFVVDIWSGKILAMEEVPANPDPELGGPPPLLSQTGCFDAVDPTQPKSDLIPFAPSAQLWSDGASKRRWMVVPDGETVTIKADGDFEFPIGSVLVKEFSLGNKKVETRFLVRQVADGKWAGYSYQWNADDSDATLVAATGAEVDVGGQTWFFPTRAQCSQCHTAIAGHVLGAEMAQLEHDITYAATGRTANQVATLEHIGLIDPVGQPAFPSLTTLDDNDATAENKARAYLHVNCSGCHRPSGPTFTPLDLRYATPLAEMGICDVRPTISDLDIVDPYLFAPGAPERSVLYRRLATEDRAIRMPPIGRTLTHTEAAAVVAQWIGDTLVCPQ